MRKISLLHPFSAKSIGLNDNDLYYSHSKPHEKALSKLQLQDYAVYIDYFTADFFPYIKEINNIKKRFWPITKPILKRRHVWRKQHSLFHYLFNLINTPDLTIINMSGHGSAYCFKLAKLLNSKKRPYIAMIGGLHVSNNLEAEQYYQNAHHIIVHTLVQKKQLQQEAIFESLDIQVLPLGIDTTLFSPIKKKNLENIELLFVGRISRLKQLEFCLEALSYLVHNQNKKVSLNIVGPISDRVYYVELLNLAKKLKILSNLSFKGSVEHQALVPFYQNANLLLLPSAHESFGMVMVEAMACGTPVIALRGSGGPDELIVDGFNGFLCDKTNFNTRVSEVFKDKDLENRLSYSARQSVLAHWSLDTTIQSLQESVKRALQ